MDNSDESLPLFRLRFGQYRIIYHIRENVVYIFAVIHRKEFDSAIKDLIKSYDRAMTSKALSKDTC